MSAIPFKRTCHSVKGLFISLLLLLLFFSSAGSLNAQVHRSADPLPSWNDGASRKTIIDFVEKVTDPRSPSYVAPENRISSFDLDGTLMPEKPFYIQVAFMSASIRAQADGHPEWREEQPFKAVLENDVEYLGRIKTAEVGRLLEASYPGLSIEDFEKNVRSWLSSTGHPRLGFCYGVLVYSPMVELIAYLRSAGFKIYLCTGSTTEFSRILARKFFSLPAEQVIGSRMGFEFKSSPQGSEIIRKPQIVLFNNRGEKAINLELQVGKRPVIAVGNSNGDIEMFQYAAGRKGPSLAILVHHDDETREYSYDRGAEKALQMAKERNWLVVSMKRDFRNIFLVDMLEEKK